jgi:hypothetical protein
MVSERLYMSNVVDMIYMSNFLDDEKKALEVAVEATLSRAIEAAQQEARDEIHTTLVQARVQGVNLNDHLGEFFIRGSKSGW